MRRTRRTRGRDPKWITARFDGADTNGQAYKRGERLFWYPNSGTILAGEAAQNAAADFASCLFDEAVMNGGLI